MTTIRAATIDDCTTILALIRELAVYEKLEHEVTANADDLRVTLFGERPSAEVLLALEDDEVAGFALFFGNYSTFLGKPGIYLEDLFVRETLRGRGHGKALISAVARIAVARGCGRMEWSVLDWNEPALRFYRSLGAEPMTGWTVQRLTGPALAALGTGAA